MSQGQRTSGPQFRGDRPQEQPAVRTTIVGGRPPGSGQPIGEIPRGIEVLVKKASVDPAFRDLLLQKRAEAADEIGLRLDPAEVMMLRVVPTAQLEAIIARTTVPQEHRRVFLGKVAAAMLAATGLMTQGCVREEVKGIRPDRGPATTGSQPDLPERPEPPARGKDSIAPGPERPQHVEPSDGDRPAPSEPAGPTAAEGQSTPAPSEEEREPIIRGIRPDRPPSPPPAPTGIRPDRP